MENKRIHIHNKNFKRETCTTKPNTFLYMYRLTAKGRKNEVCKYSNESFGIYRCA